jgi:hypothetical protein
VALYKAPSLPTRTWSVSKTMSHWFKMLRCYGYLHKIFHPIFYTISNEAQRVKQLVYFSLNLCWFLNTVFHIKDIPWGFNVESYRQGPCIGGSHSQTAYHFFKSLVRSSFPSQAHWLNPISLRRQRSRESWFETSSGKKKCETPISTYDWMWWFVPVILAIRGTTNRKTVVQVIQGIKWDPISKIINIHC